MNISIFAKPPYWIRHLQRVSSIIRGEQIAAYLQNARLNPPSGYENDICIYVKPYIPIDYDFKFEGRPYLDMLDGYPLLEVMKKYEKVPIIVFSDYDYEDIAKQVKNRLVLIPHHHCNFERSVRTRDAIKRVGLIGSPEAFKVIPQEIRDGITKRGMTLVEHSNFYPRTVVCDFYKAMDVMLLWRPYEASRNPFKIVNASAFGVPTVALDEPWFKEMDGCYIPTKTPEEWLRKLDELRESTGLYSTMVKTCLVKAEKYHIDNIAKLYQQLT